MCILFIARNQHPQFSLIIAANRDESYDRPSSAMHYWQDKENILAGRDLSKGGSWLGVNTQGNFCAVTNFRTGKPADPNAKSRGDLVQSYLSGDFDQADFIRYLKNNSKQYNPFNLVFGNIEKLIAFSSEDRLIRQISNGCHSISNGFLDQQWPKMSGGIQRLTDLVKSKKEIRIAELNKIMQDQSKANIQDLPSTGVSQDIETHLSSIFIQGEGYGTRTTTYLFFNHQSILINEINYNSKGKEVEHQQFIQDLS